MLVFSSEVQDFVISTYELLLAECEIVKGVLGGQTWVLTDGVRDSLWVLLKLPCVDNSHSAVSLAWELFNCEFDFEDKPLLAA